MSEIEVRACLLRAVRMADVARLGRGLLGLIMIALAFVGCGGGTDRQSVAELRVGIEDHPKTLDPRYATDAYGMRIAHGLLFSTLVEEGFDLQFTPGLAERWETPDETTYIFHLRRGVAFQDGAPVTAADVKFTYEHLMDAETRSSFAETLRSQIASIETPDSHTVKIKLTRPMGVFLSSAVMPILPEHVVRNEKDFASRLIGSGPFKLASQSAGEIVLVPNEHYYGGAPKVGRLVFKVVTDDNTRVLKMRKGELDLAINALPLDKMDEFKNPPLSEKYRMIEEPGLSYNYIAFNLQDSVLQDLRVRKAIALGINVEEIIAYRLGNHAVRASGLLAPINPFYEKDVVLCSYNPQESMRLLEEAGLRHPGGNVSEPRLTLELKTSNNAQAVGVARILQSQLAAIGIRLNTRSYEWGTFYGDIRSGNFQLTTMRWVGIIDPDFYFDIFHSSRMPPAGSNRGRYADGQMDRLLEAGRFSSDPARRRVVYSEVQKRVAENLPYVSLWHVNNISLVHHRVEGYRQHPTGGFLSFRDMRVR